MSPSPLRRYRAERLLRNEFAVLRSKVLVVVRSQLRSKGITLDPADLEVCYAQAWQGLYATILDGKEIENPTAWLVRVTFRRAIDESRAAARARNVTVHAADAAAADIVGEIDDRARLRQVFEALRSRLSERERQAASLCYLQGLSRAHAAERMGISEARMRKLMEGAPGRPGVAAKVGQLLDTIEAGGWCEEQSSLMRAYAFGVLDPQGERHALAVAHVRQCPACRAHVASLRGLASVLPLPFLPLALGAAKTLGAPHEIRATRVGGMQPRQNRGWLGVRGGGKPRRAGVGAARGVRGGWSGLGGGSLGAKLAVIALVVAGGGYALLGPPARGGSPSRRSIAPGIGGNARVAGVAPLVPFSSAPASRRRVPARVLRISPVRSSRHAQRHPARRGALRGGETEFRPERSRGERSPATSSGAARRGSPSGSRRAGEFGIE
jgi:RNA polymerase sigma factor (sigma-70 family)